MPAASSAYRERGGERKNGGPTMTTIWITRRGAVATAAAGLLTALLPGAPALTERAAGPAQRVLGIFRDREAAASIGRVYLRQRPEEHNEERMLALLMGDASPASTGERLDEAALHAALRRRLREDFACGRTVWVDGWLLSATEARLCALAAMA
jgi:hypothetical protein